MKSPHPIPILPESVDEETVRRLCGPGIFAGAERLWRDGHVLSPKLGESGLEASIRGTWRRVDHVTVQARAGRLVPTCTRDGEIFCRHVGALLLQCLRNPGSLTAHEQPGNNPSGMVSSRPGAATLPNDAVETPAAEFSRLLNQDTANHLRQIARQRGVRLSGNKKVDLIQQLTGSLLLPASIDAAIAALDRDQRVALDATHIVSAETSASTEGIKAGMRALGHKTEPPLDAVLDALLDTGLVALLTNYASGSEGFVVPRAVAARLPPLPDLARSADPIPAKATVTNDASTLGIVETIQVIAQAALADRIVLRQKNQQGEWPGYAPGDFVVDPTEAADQRSPAQGQGKGRLLVPPPLLADPRQLADRTGLPVETLDFVVQLMLDVQIADASPDLTIRFDRLQALLDMPPSDRLARLASAWLLGAGPFAFDHLFGPNGAIELRWQQAVAPRIPPFQPGAASAARLVARLVSRMPADASFDLASFAGTVEQLAPQAAPTLLQLRAIFGYAQTLTMTLRTGSGKLEHLNPRASEGWSRFLVAVVTALLAGPLTWLGLVEVTSPSGQPRIFRIRPEADVLAGRRVDIDATEHARKLVVSDNLTVLVPPGAADVDLHGLLARAGTLVDASMVGLQYRLTPAGVQAVFDTGMTGPELIRILTDHAGGALPETARKELDRWWRHYGTVRLYDELTIIELSDDLLLAELVATTPLASAIVQTFSPRLIAIDTARTEEVIAELATRGYAPRVIEES